MCGGKERETGKGKEGGHGRAHVCLHQLFRLIVIYHSISWCIRIFKKYTNCFSKLIPNELNITKII